MPVSANNSVYTMGLGLEGGLRPEGDYSWDHSAGDYLKLYKKLFTPDEESDESECEENPVVVDIQ